MDIFMKLKISEDRYVTITARMVEAAVFLLLAVALAAVLGRKTLRAGRAVIDRLDRELQSVSFETDKTAVYVGDALEITPVTAPKNAEVSYTWELADDGVLAVKDGRIVADSCGETVLGVSVGSFSAQITVVAKHKPLPPDSTLPPLYYDKLLIANYCNTLPSDYVADDLMRIPQKYAAENYAAMYVSAETFAHYRQLLDGMKAALGSGTRMRIISAYRSYAKQTELYNKAVRRYIAEGKTSVEARALALNTTQTPGNSEHQLGSTIDVSNDTSTDHDYQKTPEGQWLAENAHQYGFIIRYPADKEEITRIAYEPWHIRYVGVTHATYMYVHHLCLEEYIELQKKGEEAAEDYAADHPATVEEA